LGDIPFVGGTTYTLFFECNDQNGGEVDLSGATARWKAAPFGTSYAVINKSGSIISTNVFAVYLSSADTIALSGKFSHQPQITFADGTVVIPAQGTVTIVGGL